MEMVESSKEIEPELETKAVKEQADTSKDGDIDDIMAMLDAPKEEKSKKDKRKEKKKNKKEKNKQDDDDLDAILAKLDGPKLVTDSETPAVSEQTEEQAAPETPEEPK